MDNRPLIERIADKAWKARIGAYDDLKKEISSIASEDSELFTEFAPFLIKMTSDSHAGALDSGFDTATQFVHSAPQAIALQHADKLYSNAVDKSFSARVGTLQKGKALLYKLMEIDTPTACVTYLLTRLGDKKPKIPPTCLDVIKDAITMFGARSFPVKEILKAVPTVLNGNNSAARESCMHLMVELHRWIGAAPFVSLVESLRSAQKTEFETLVAAHADTPAPVPTIYLRKEQGQAAAAAAEGGSSNVPAQKAGGASAGAAAGGSGGGIDSREFVDEVDLNKKLGKTEYATLIAEEKWSEQLKGLQLVLDAIGPVPKIQRGADVQDIVATCKGFLRQGHVQLQVSSLKILAQFADGMRAEFGPTVRPVTQMMLQKCKEKRLVPEVEAAMQVVFMHCLVFDSCIDDTVELFKNKKNPPHTKISGMHIVEAVLKMGGGFTGHGSNAGGERVSPDNLKALADALVSVCEDSDPKVREACATALHALYGAAKVK